MANVLTDAQILRGLKTKRKELIEELERVTLAIYAYELPKRKQVVHEEYYNEDVAQAALLYDHKMTLEEKVFHALSRLGAGDAVDIANYIMILDKEVTNKKRVYERVTYTASKMFKQGLIDAVVLNKRNVYKMVEEKED